MDRLVGAVAGWMGTTFLGTEGASPQVSAAVFGGGIVLGILGVHLADVRRKRRRG